MKQQITLQDWYRADKKITDNFTYFMIDHEYWPASATTKDVISSELPSIGQIIEFLDENAEFEEKDTLSDYLTVWSDRKDGITNMGGFSIKWWMEENEKIELCDVLWQAVKEVLDK